MIHRLQRGKVQPFQLPAIQAIGWGSKILPFAEYLFFFSLVVFKRNLSLLEILCFVHLVLTKWKNSGPVA